jgi:prevent-host-death family protein
MPLKKPIVVSIRTARASLDQLVAKVAGGSEVIIARRGVPMARLVAEPAMAPRRVFGSMKGRATVTDAFFERLPASLRRGWT